MEKTAPRANTAITGKQLKLGSHAFIDAFALVYHRAVADRLREQPEQILNHARQNLRRWMANDRFGDGERPALDEWQEILNSSTVERLVEIIIEDSDDGQRLRSSSPFIGLLTASERREILNAIEEQL